VKLEKKFFFNHYSTKTMRLLAIDLGGTKLAIGVFSIDGELLSEEKLPLNKRSGNEVGKLITKKIKELLAQCNVEDSIQSIGISVPGIFHKSEGTVWAPNISGWQDYPLLKEVRSIAGEVPVIIDSDRSCYILGEWWKGAAKDCTDAIFLAVGTGIGAGILIDEKILRGSNDIAGAIGWMALEPPFRNEYIECGCFESCSSGDGIAKLAKRLLSTTNGYTGILKNKTADTITSFDVFDAYDKQDVIAKKLIDHSIEYWGMAVANLVSLFNPQKIIFGGGVFGPAVKFIPAIYDEAVKWAQPISMKQVKLEASILGSNAGLYGAAFLAKQNLYHLTGIHEK
jgi:glucokinase